MEKTELLKFYFGEVPEVNQQDVKLLQILLKDSQGDWAEFEFYFDSFREGNPKLEKVAILSRILALCRDRIKILKLSTEEEKEQKLKRWRSSDKHDINSFYRREHDFYPLWNELKLGAL